MLHQSTFSPLNFNSLGHWLQIPPAHADFRVPCSSLWLADLRSKNLASETKTPCGLLLCGLRCFCVENSTVNQIKTCEAFFSPSLQIHHQGSPYETNVFPDAFYFLLAMNSSSYNLSILVYWFCEFGMSWKTLVQKGNQQGTGWTTH